MKIKKLINKNLLIEVIKEELPKSSAGVILSPTEAIPNDAIIVQKDENIDYLEVGDKIRFNHNSTHDVTLEGKDYKVINVSNIIYKHEE
jgi:co-chaperonin GroES (HSP10)